MKYDCKSEHHIEKDVNSGGLRRHRKPQASQRFVERGAAPVCTGPHSLACCNAWSLLHKAAFISQEGDGQGLLSADTNLLVDLGK